MLILIWSSLSWASEYSDLIISTSEFFRSKSDFTYFHKGFPVYSREKIFVKQGDIVIADRGFELTTAGLATCSAIAISFGEKILLGHIDAQESQSALIVTKIKELFGDTHPESVEILVLGGAWDNTWSLHRIRVALEDLGLSNKIRYLSDVGSIHKTFGVGSNGTFLLK